MAAAGGLFLDRIPPTPSTPFSGFRQGRAPLPSVPGRMIRPVNRAAESQPAVAEVDWRQDPDWLTHVVDALGATGCAVVTGVLDEALLAKTREAMYDVQRRIRNEIGESRLTRAGELGVLRLMLRHDPHFFKFLELEPVLGVVDATLSDTAILHLQNGLVLPSFSPGEAPDVFQLHAHRDFPRVLNGYVMSINTFFAIDEFGRTTARRRRSGNASAAPAAVRDVPEPVGSTGHLPGGSNARLRFDPLARGRSKRLGS